MVPGHPASTCAGLDLEPNTLSVDPVPLCLPARRPRDFPSERFWAGQVGNHWLCAPGCPPQPLGAAWSLLASTSLSVQRTAITVPATATAHGCRAPGPRGSRADRGRRDGCQRRVPSLRLTPPGAEEQPQASRRTRNNRARLRSKASGCPKSRV